MLCFCGPCIAILQNKSFIVIRLEKHGDTCSVVCFFLSYVFLKFSCIYFRKEQFSFEWVNGKCTD